MERLTGKRVNGIREGYWSPARKDDLIQRLGEYEDLGLSPGQLRMITAAVPDLVMEVRYGKD